jgi:hypothetical protein
MSETLNETLRKLEQAAQAVLDKVLDEIENGTINEGETDENDSRH